MRRCHCSFILLLFVFLSVCHACLDLHSIMARSVRSSGSAYVSVDSVLVETEVGHGIAHSLVSLVLTPSSTGHDIEDSLEITCDMVLPPDFAVTNLYLWIDGVRQIAVVQDRALALAQYEQIVERRKDPAILEYEGSGRYRLRIFPARQSVSRKVAVGLEHRFDNIATGTIEAEIPLCFYPDTSWSEALSTIHSVRQRLTARDERSYAFAMPGLGEGDFEAGSPLELVAQGVTELAQGVITSPDTAGEFFWTGRDQVHGRIFGFRADLSITSLLREAQPGDRIIVVDIRHASLVDAARKLAVLCLHQYLRPDSRFNLVLAADTSTGWRCLFDSSGGVSKPNLQSAYAALREMQEVRFASTVVLLQKGLSLASDGVVILISDLAIAASSPPAEEIRGVVSESSVRLFAISDSELLTSLALAMGGRRLASLDDEVHFPFKVCITPEGGKQYEPALPDLFSQGSQLWGISGLRVTPLVNATDVVLHGIPHRDTLRIFVAGATAAPPAQVGVLLTGEVHGFPFTREYLHVLPQEDDEGLLSTVSWAFLRAEELNAGAWNSERALFAADSIRMLGLNYNFASYNTSLLALEPGTPLFRNARSNTATIRFFELSSGALGAVSLDAAFLAGGVRLNTAGFSEGAYTSDQLTIALGPPTHPGLYYVPPAGDTKRLVGAVDGDQLSNVSFEKLVAGEMTTDARRTQPGVPPTLTLKVTGTRVLLAGRALSPGATASLCLYTASGRRVGVLSSCVSSNRNVTFDLCDIRPHPARGAYIVRVRYDNRDYVIPLVRMTTF